MIDESSGIYSYIYKHEVNQMDIYIAITKTGQIRIGSDLQLRRAHLPSLPPWNNLHDTWVNLLIKSGSGKVLVHLIEKDGALWCNIGEDLIPNNKEFPYLFMTKLRYLSLVKKAKEIGDKHDDYLRQHRLLNGIDLNR